MQVCAFFKLKGETEILADKRVSINTSPFSDGIGKVFGTSTPLEQKRTEQNKRTTTNNKKQNIRADRQTFRSVLTTQ